MSGGEQLSIGVKVTKQQIDEVLGYLDRIEEQLPIQKLLEYLGLRKRLRLVEESWGIKGECPFCSESGFEVYFRNNYFVCISCKKRGGSIDFLSYYRFLRFRETLVMAAEILRSLSFNKTQEQANP